MIQPAKRMICLDDLNPAERLELAQELWDSVSDADDTFPPSPAVSAELKRRNAAFEADGNPGSTWEEVKARLRSAT